jgi:hypothetical protein
MKNTSLRLIAASLFGALAIQSAAQADTVDLTLGNLGFNTVTGVNWNSGIGGYTNEYTSWINATVTGVSGPLASALITPPTAFQLFCIQLLQNVNIGGSYTYDFGTLQATGVPDSTPGALSAAGRDQVRNMYGNALLGTDQYATADAAAGFQLALWEITFDGANNTNDGATTGVFRTNASGDTLTNFNNYLSSALVTNADLNVFGLQNQRIQDFLIDFPGGGGSGGEDLPLPGSLSLLGLGLVGLASTRRNMKK